MTGVQTCALPISGEVNPSGRTADTYAADLTASPWWNNFGDFKYTNATELDSDSSSFDPAGATASFVNYAEGIYVGYKFYETAADEGQDAAVNVQDEAVDEVGSGRSQEDSGSAQILSLAPAACGGDRKSTRLNSSHDQRSRMPSSA